MSAFTQHPESPIQSAASNGLFALRSSDGVFLERSVRSASGFEAVAELKRSLKT